MARLPFQTFEEARHYFEVPIPEMFFTTLDKIDKFCQENDQDTLYIIFELFGILRIEGKEARYQQTPIEMFPFGSTGSDGIHYGFIIHTLNEEDYPSGEICPMDSDGVVVIGNNSEELFQNLLEDETSVNSFLPLLKELNLNPTITQRERYDKLNNVLRVNVKAKKGWRFLETADGAGVFAEEFYFDEYHEIQHDFPNRHKAIAKYEDLATEMGKRGLYASQLYYLKELYWNEWTNYDLAKKYLSKMLQAYHELNRPHLYEVTKWTIDIFHKRYAP